MNFNARDIFNENSTTTYTTNTSQFLETKKKLRTEHSDQSSSMEETHVRNLLRRRQRQRSRLHRTSMIFLVKLLLCATYSYKWSTECGVWSAHHCIISNVKYICIHLRTTFKQNIYLMIYWRNAICCCYCVFFATRSENVLYSKRKFRICIKCFVYF